MELFPPWMTPSGGDDSGDSSSGSGGSEESGSVFSGDTVDTLQTFAGSPGGFVFGLLLEPVLGGFENLVIGTIETINFLFFGSAEGTVGTLGLADLLPMLAELLIRAGSAVGAPLIDIGSRTVDDVLGLAENAGVFGLIIAAVVIGVVVIFYAEYIRRRIEVVADFVPGLEAFLP